MPTYLIARDVSALADAIRVADLSVAQVAGKAEVTRQYLGRLIAGERVRINSRSAALIEETLGKPRGSLFRLEEEDLSPYLPEDAA